MATVMSRLPAKFPVGTKFVIESHGSGQRRVFSRHIEMPDGTFVKLPSWPAKRSQISSRRSRKVRQ
ncbi:MAG: hypothetical protein JOZ70_01275 [Pseudolabrys sp.]|nr:hypothetical protein [Pseudolabrys sp.]MBV9953856.1 hypothetical protein [Pseudolabrys sp.]